MTLTWTDRFPNPDHLRGEVTAMVAAFSEALQAHLPAGVLRGVYFKGSASKVWDSPVDYVPELSDVDLHVYFHDGADVAACFGGMDEVLSLQANVEERYARLVAAPLHVPRVQLVVMNKLLEDPMYSPTPPAVVTTLLGEPYAAHPCDEATEREQARARVRECGEALLTLPLRYSDSVGPYLLPRLRDLNWRVSPTVPRVLLLLGAPFEETWTLNRTQLLARLIAMGETELAEHYQAYYLHAWDFLLSSYRDFPSARSALRAGARVLYRALALANQTE